MRILDRHIFGSVIRIFLGCMLLFIFLYVLIDVFSRLDDFLKAHVKIMALVDYYSLRLPNILINITPISCLLATLFTLGGLNRNNEIVTMRASGLSIFQISQTLIVFGIVVSAFMFLVNEKLLPQAQVKADTVEIRLTEKNKKEDKKEDSLYRSLYIYGLRNRLYSIEKLSLMDNAAEGITILEHDERQNLTMKIVAERGIWKDNMWTFYKCFTFHFDEQGRIKGEPEYNEEEIMDVTESPRDFLSQKQNTGSMDIPKLNDYIWRLSRSGASSAVRKLKVDLYQKFSLPFTSLVIIFLGIPFALKIRKRAAGVSSVGFSMIVGFLFYVVNAISIALGKVGVLPPLLAAWLSNIIFFIVAIYLIYEMP